MNNGTKKKGRRIRVAALAMTAIVGLVACAESSSKETVSTDSVAEVKTKNAALTTCTFDTKCVVGSMGAAGGTVIYNSPSNFTCGSSGPVALPCNFLEVASADWGSVLSQGGKINPMSECQVGANSIDLKCPWSGFDSPQPTTTKSDVGVSKKNFDAIKAATNQDVNVVAPAAGLPTQYVSAAASPNVEANPFNLPSLSELVLTCNYANGSPLRTDQCVPGTLKPDFQPNFYWSSTIAASDMNQPVYAVNFKTGEISKQSRKNSFFIRPTRSFYSTLDAAVSTTVAPTTLPATTMPPVPTTVAAARVRACTPTSPCIPGDKREGTGGTVFLYVAAGFGCGSNPSSMRCVMMEFAQDDWASKLPTSIPWNGCLPKTGVDPTCPYTNMKYPVSVDSKREVGLGYQNSSTIANNFGTTDVFAANNFAWGFKQDTVTGFQNWNLPSLDELVQLCNWANGSAPRADVCTPNVLKPGFSRGVYVSSTIDPSDPDQKVWAVNFGTGEIFKQARTVSSYVRPVRTLRGYIEPGYVPPTTVTPATIPATTAAPTTVPRTTLPPTTLPATTVPRTTLPPTTVPRTTLPPTTLPPTTLAPTTLPPTTVVTCAGGGVCALGDRGPGGGTVFFASKTGFKCGENLDKTCYYLELAPATWRFSPYTTCSMVNTFMNCKWVPSADYSRPVTSTALGYGAKNTAAMGAVGWNPAVIPVRGVRIGVRTDWFIPSEREANELCKWANKAANVTSLGDTTKDCSASSAALDFVVPAAEVWTSSDVDATTAWTVNLGTAQRKSNVSKLTAATIWPIRAF